MLIVNFTTHGPWSLALVLSSLSFSLDSLLLASRGSAGSILERVEPRARLQHGGVAAFRPLDEGAHRLEERFTQIGQAVFNARRFGRENVARNHAVAFERAQCVCEHPLRDVRNRGASIGCC
jgi:hypothetical protein